MKLAVLLVLGTLAYGGELRNLDVCVRNEYSLNSDTIRYLTLSLKSYEKALGAVLRFTCDSETPDSVTIRLRGIPAGFQNADALGAVPARGGHVLGQVEVFCDPVRRMVRTRRPATPAVEGWALARVAAHELFHYRRQQSGHGDGELNDGVMTPDRLIEGFGQIAGLERSGR